jgi:RNA recognition motif-containing protein
MNIFVANLNFRVKTDQLQELFEQYGEVDSVKIITDRDSGRSKGFGFIEMADETAARNAISKLDNQELEGRNIVVKEARPRE